MRALSLSFLGLSVAGKGVQPWAFRAWSVNPGREF